MLVVDEADRVRMPLEIATRPVSACQEESFGIEEVVDPTGYLAEPRDLLRQNDADSG